MNKSESKYYNTALLMDEALLLLLEKKEYDFITVKEICQKAGVNRSTFYSHFNDKYELFISLINNLKQELENDLKSIEEDNLKDYYLKMISLKSLLKMTIINSHPTKTLSW